MTTTQQTVPDVFQAIANPTRRALLGILRSGEMPATVLSDQFDMTQPAVSQQLRVLRTAGLIAERRVGRQRLYHLNPAPLLEVAEWMRQYEHFWQDKFDRLGQYLDDQERPAQVAAPRRSPRRRNRVKKGSRG